MTATVNVKAKLIPWDDREFVESFERAHEQVVAAGCCPEGPEAAARVQTLLHEAGFTDASIEVERTPEEALAHVSHWVVRRDG